ncbi:hypothetical protein VCUG_00144 [Vavraia culicis subsp. floridensis]|uniref:Uncharacterized protein n=1 Tax=Vavraia culicis (isolate floridensis) TaxID=948595 RepID=L2GYE4_VAVCU|nr:uncharacterized protein VCUG_00144 [Vavraia culicis subsp. floridensis]ELA48308.1 hypothetical protein VCUG_00144 [Vavraia culicis subsp. floridensis]
MLRQDGKGMQRYMWLSTLVKGCFLGHIPCLLPQIFCLSESIPLRCARTVSPRMKIATMYSSLFLSNATYDTVSVIGCKDLSRCPLNDSPGPTVLHRVCFIFLKEHILSFLSYLLWFDMFV